MRAWYINTRIQAINVALENTSFNITYYKNKKRKTYRHYMLWLSREEPGPVVDLIQYILTGTIQEVVAPYVIPNTGVTQVGEPYCLCFSWKERLTAN